MTQNKYIATAFYGFHKSISQKKAKRKEGRGIVIQASPEDPTLQDVILEHRISYYPSCPSFLNLSTELMKSLEEMEFTETLASRNEAYEDEKLSRTQVYFWYKRFKDGRKSIADDSRSGRPLTSTTDRNIGQVRDLIVADRKITIDNISEILGISYGSCQKIIGEHLNMKKLCVLIETENNDSAFFKTIITGDETWCFLFDPQTKKQSLEWHTPSSRKKKVRLDKSKGKVMLVVFFDYQGLVYYEFIKEGFTINKQTYKEILVRLRDAKRRKRNQLFKSKQWKLLHDNAPAHRAIIVQDYLAKHSVSVLSHPPYSPDIAPCDFFFFPKLKMTLKGRRFSSSSKVIENATVELNKIIKIDFELAFQQLFSLWKKKCVDNQGFYFEKFDV
ncbi:hypothetical protein LAZ67_12000886 [Cordylochernes scorpioides]|uniref:Transposase n=1 Tax=Cordylochernes scorpioides TaxID=51811 RepID=A0ABY6L0W3_9ARAC|nr:hypothetical protein LAZ67_12000886 [Cordylochernes scorpioides]